MTFTTPQDLLPLHFFVNPMKSNFGEWKEYEVALSNNFHLRECITYTPCCGNKDYPDLEGLAKKYLQ